MLSFHAILEQIAAQRPDFDRKRLESAYAYASRFHEGQKRLSGDPYMSHVLAVVENLLPLRPDDDTLVAALLHGLTSKNREYNKEEVTEMFGENVVFLITAVEGLRRVKSRNVSTEAESLRRMFVTMAQDIRVVFIKMADRLHNMETVGVRSVAKQKELARETLDLYVPISARMGMYHIKGTLEDIAFRCLYPAQFKQLSQELEEYTKQRESSIEEIITDLRQYLARSGISARLEGRVKNLLSVYQKLKLKTHTSLSDLYDIFAIRIILPDRYDSEGKELTDHLYSVLGLLHSKWAPLPNRFKDYVAAAKPNGYRSLHTAVMGLSHKANQPTEIQIRTRRMHEESEYGIASHWVYKDFGKGGSRASYSVKTLAAEEYGGKRYLEWLSDLSSDDGGLKSGKEFLDALKIDAFTDRIFVMTPTGEVKDLPKGSTPVDFAYAIHTDVGHRCQLAKANGSIIPLSHRLKNGDTVEIVTGKNSTPKPAWLSFVKTSGAKAKIRSFIRSMNKEDSFRVGKEMVNSILERLGQPLLDDSLSLFKLYNGNKYSLRERTHLIEEIGNGSILAATVVKKALGLRHRSHGPKALKPPGKVSFAFPRKKVVGAASGDEVIIQGERGFPYRLAHCCKPVPGLPIVAYINRGHVLTVHLQSCRLLRSALPERVLDARFGSDELVKYPVKLQLTAKDRVGLIRDVADIITTMGINILVFSDVKREKDTVHREIVLEVSGDEEYSDIVQKLQRIRGVLEVTRIKTVV